MNDFQKWCKEILPVVQAAANGDVIEARFKGNSGEKNWIESQYDWECFGRSREYRIKPRTIKVNGFDVPKAITKKPKLGSSIFIANISAMDFYQLSEWHDADQQNRALQRGLVHSAEESAIAHAKAMLGIDPNKED